MIYRTKKYDYKFYDAGVMKCGVKKRIKADGGRCMCLTQKIDTSGGQDWKLQKDGEREMCGRLKTDIRGLSYRKWNCKFCSADMLKYGKNRVRRRQRGV